MKDIVLRFLKKESGATEYGLIAAGIAVAIMVVVGNIGSELHAIFESFESPLK